MSLESIPIPLLKGDQGIQGVKGDKGDTGAVGVGVPIGGQPGQPLVKASGADYVTSWGISGYISTLPPTPYDGQEIYLAVAGNTVWHLKWAQVNGVWLFIGGGALAAYDGSPVGLGGTSTPNIAIPYQGQYLVRFGGGVYVYTSGSAYASVTLIGPGYTDPGGLQIFSGSAMASSGSTERMATFTGTAGGIYTQWGASVNAVVATAWRWISLMPVWIKI